MNLETYIRTVRFPAELDALEEAFGFVPEECLDAMKRGVVWGLIDGLELRHGGSGIWLGMQRDYLEARHGDERFLGTRLRGSCDEAFENLQRLAALGIADPITTEEQEPVQ